MKKKHLKILKDIQDRIPRELLLSITMKEKQFGTLKQIAERALTEPDDVVSKEKKQQLKDMIDSGYLDREVDVIDKDIEKQIDKFIENEIAKEVKAGTLPSKAPKLRLKNNKGKQYARRQAARLKALFKGDASGSEGQNDPSIKEESGAR